LNSREPSFGFEDLAPEGVELITFRFFLRGRFDFGMFVDGIELTALDRIEKDFGGFLDTFEEVVILSAPCGCFLIRVVAEDLLTVGALDLIFGCFVAILGDSEDGIMILALLWSVRIFA